MKTLFTTSIALLTLGCILAQARVVTLVVNNNPTAGTVVLSNSVSVAANETAVIKSYGPLTYGGTPSSPDCYFTLLIGGTQMLYSYATDAVGITIAGPAEIRLYTLITDPHSGNGPQTAFITVEIKPESFPPDKTIILPEGTVGVIHVESSTNLIQWQEEWANTYSNTNQNRFFRIRAERSLP